MTMFIDKEEIFCLIIKCCVSFSQLCTYYCVVFSNAFVNPKCNLEMYSLVIYCNVKSSRKVRHKPLILSFLPAKSVAFFGKFLC